MSKTSIVVIIASLITIVGCQDRTINPFEGTSSFFFSMYGAIDLESEVSYIRIKDYETFFLADSLKIKVPNVTFENTENGESWVLKDTVINYNGNYTYNYIVDEGIEAGAEYLLTATSPDQEKAYVTIHIPGITEAGNGVSQEGEVSVYSVFNCSVFVDYIFDNVKPEEHVRMEAGFKYQGETHWGEIGSVDKPRPVEGMNRHKVRLTITNLLVDVFPPPSEATVGREPAEWRPAVGCPQLDDSEVKIRYIHFSEDWYELRGSKLIDLDLLESETITNGLGFVGGIRRGEYQFGVQYR